MNAQELRQNAKAFARMTLLVPSVIKGKDVDDFVDSIIDAAVKAAVAEITEHYQVDVPNTSYFGIIVKADIK